MARDLEEPAVARRRADRVNPTARNGVQFREIDDGDGH